VACGLVRAFSYCYRSKQTYISRTPFLLEDVTVTDACWAVPCIGATRAEEQQAAGFVLVAARLPPATRHAFCSPAYRTAAA
jgi:hypothetical protein